MAQGKQQDTDGCWGCLGALLLGALVVAAVISIAALIDPFDWMPPVGEVWADCQEESYGSGECDLEERFPGFWWHVAANFGWAVVQALLLVGVIASAAEYRTARAARFDGAEAAEKLREVRSVLAGVAVAAVAVAALPLVAALLW